MYYANKAGILTELPAPSFNGLTQCFVYVKKMKYTEID